MANVYSSRTNRLEVVFSRPELSRAPALSYLLLYQAVGCPDLPSDSNSWSLRSDDDGIAVWCNFTKDVYHLKCSEGVWIGESPNCSSSPAIFSLNSENTTEKSTLTSYGVSVVVVVVVAVVMGNLVLIVGTAFLKRRLRNAESASVRLSPESIFLGKRRAETKQVVDDPPNDIGQRRGDQDTAPPTPNQQTLQR